MDWGIKRLKGKRNTSKYLCAGGNVMTNASTFNFSNFDVTDVDINFISNALSKICRYNGNIGSTQLPDNTLYSVGQHSVLMAQSALIALGDPHLAMACLFHDSPEAYIGDFSSPIKKKIKHIIKPIEDHIEKTIFGYLGIEHADPLLIKQLDLNICEYEITFILKGDVVDGAIWSPKMTNEMFMKLYKQICELIEYDKLPLATEQWSHNLL